MKYPVCPVFWFGNFGICTYCGDSGNSKDHVIPISYQTDIPRQSGNPDSGPMTYACLDCNSHLSNRYFDSFIARCEWASWRLEVQAKAVEWTRSEIKRLDYSLRTFIEAETNRRIWLRQRADWFQSPAFWMNLENLKWTDILLVGTETYCKALRNYFIGAINEIDSIYADKKS